METHRPRLIERIAIAIAVPALNALGLTSAHARSRPDGWSMRTARENALWSLWHETLLLGTWFYRRIDVHVMISASRDGELIARITAAPRLHTRALARRRRDRSARRASSSRACARASAPRSRPTDRADRAAARSGRRGR
jgi:hypothetical protein